MPVPQKKIKMSTIIYSFYTYMGLKVIYEDTTKNSFELPHRIFNKNFEQLSPLVESWIEDLAVSLRDYLAIISWGEARHAVRYAEYFIPEILNTNTRKKAYTLGAYYNPDKFLPKVGILFSRHWTNENFGGENWYKISNAASMMYHSVKPTVFVDYIMDLIHNGNTCFDKKVLINLDFSPLNILDHKRNNFIWEPEYTWAQKSASIHPVVYDLFSLACRHSIINISDENPSGYMNRTTMVPATEYTPPKIKWGVLPLSEIKEVPTRYSTEWYQLTNTIYPRHYKAEMDKIKERTKEIKMQMKKQMKLFKGESYV